MDKDDLKDALGILTVIFLVGSAVAVIIASIGIGLGISIYAIRSALGY